MSAALTRLAREESGRVLALLARRLDDVDLADESVQDALTEAVTDWADHGVPDNPPAWLLTVARRKAIDRLRRRASAQRRTREVAPELVAAFDEPSTGSPLLHDSGSVADDQLRLVLLCCHPALDCEAQVALTLRLVAGLSTREIAAAYLVPEATLAQRIVRAKRKIRDARIPLSVPSDPSARIDAVLGTLYLVFNEGYLAHGGAASGIRVDLADEALRLTRLVVSLAPDQAEARGLLALELFHRARLPGRLDGLGELVLLGDQDRSAWDLAQIQEANAELHRVMTRLEPGVYQIQAIIAAYHANARTAADTDWPAIVALYRQLHRMTASPVVAVNLAVALAAADGPQAGLAALDELVVSGMASGPGGLHVMAAYHPYHIARAELLAQVGDVEGAVVGLQEARGLTANIAERRHIDRRLEALAARLPPGR